MPPQLEHYILLDIIVNIKLDLREKRSINAAIGKFRTKFHITGLAADSSCFPPAGTVGNAPAERSGAPIWIFWAIMLPSTPAVPAAVMFWPIAKSPACAAIKLPIEVFSEKKTIFDAPSADFTVTLSSSTAMISPTIIPWPFRFARVPPGACPPPVIA